MRGEELKPEDLEISEAAEELLGWEKDENQSPLQAIEADIRRLIRQVAEARFAASQGERGHNEATRKLLLEMIEVLDAFDRVFANVRHKPAEMTRQMKIWVGNFRTVRRLVERMLGGGGVSTIQNVDGEFDPHWHQIAETVEDPSKPTGTIVEETRRGYVWGKQILRKTEVVVVRNPDDDAGAPASKDVDSSS